MITIGRCYVDDLTGRKFGKLTVIKRVENKKHGKGSYTAWLCQCDCGSEPIEVLAHHLKQGSVTRCGCNDNHYDLNGEFGIGYTNNKDIFYFDLEDYEKIKDYCWWKDKDGYIISSKTKKNNKVLYMHRLVMNLFNNEKCIVDHIFGKKNDNRKSQLRFATVQQNAFNSFLRVDNKSGTKGVFWRKDKNKWVASITYEYKYYSKLFGTYEEALQYRKQLEEQYFGEYAYKEEEGVV